MNQRVKDLEHAALRDNVTHGTMEAFADGAAHAREGLKPIHYMIVAYLCAGLKDYPSRTFWDLVGWTK